MPKKIQPKKLQKLENGKWKNCNTLEYKILEKRNGFTMVEMKKDDIDFKGNYRIEGVKGMVGFKQKEL